MQIQLCVLSPEFVVSLKPLLDLKTRPNKLILLITPDQQQQAHCFSQAVQRADLPVITIQLQLIRYPWDIMHTYTQIKSLLNQQPVASVSLNMSSGHHAVLLAAYEAIRSSQQQLFYVTPYENNLHYFLSDQQGQNLQRVLLEDFFIASGFQVKLCERNLLSSVPWQAIVQELLFNITYYGEALAVLDYLAGAAKQDSHSEVLYSPLLHESQLTRPLKDILHRFQDVGLLKLEANRVVFTDSVACYFAQGGWLEQYAVEVLQHMQKDTPSLQDLAYNTLIESEHGTRHSLGVSLLLGNKLWIIMCRAKKVYKAGKDIRYELNGLLPVIKHVPARVVLMAYQPLLPATLKQAKSLSVQVLQGRQLQQLLDVIQDEMQ